MQLFNWASNHLVVIVMPFNDCCASSILAFRLSQGFEQLQLLLCSSMPGMLEMPPQLPLSSRLLRMTPAAIPSIARPRIKNVNKNICIIVPVKSFIRRSHQA